MASKTGIRVLLADDHQIVRQGFRALLEREHIDVVAEAGDGQQAVELAREHQPDVAVLDIAMPGLNGLDAGRAILEASPRIAIILLTVHTEEHHIATALRAGFRGYLVKTQAVDDLVHAVRAVAAGGLSLSPSISHFLVDAYLTGSAAPVDPLTGRERQVLQLVAEGKTTKEIAASMGISVKTAESYRAHVMEKLNIHDTAGLVRYAIRRGLIEP